LPSTFSSSRTISFCCSFMNSSIRKRIGEFSVTPDSRLVCESFSASVSASAFVGSSVACKLLARCSPNSSSKSRIYHRINHSSNKDNPNSYSSFWSYNASALPASFFRRIWRFRIVCKGPPTLNLAGDPRGELGQA
jgi:hypothetical protein